MGFHKPHIPFHIPHQYLDLHDLDKFAEPVNHNRTSDLPDIAWNPWMDLRRRDDIKATFLVTDYRVFKLILVLGVANILFLKIFYGAKIFGQKCTTSDFR